MKKIYKNAKIDGRITDITIEDGKFSSFEKTALSGFDLGGLEVFPGLIDIHTHGCCGVDTMDSKFEEMSIFHAKHAVTSYLPTTMTASFDELLNVSASLPEKTEGANILGLHLEGPYISKKYKGAQSERFIKEPDISEFKKLKNVKMVTIAPELYGANDFISECGAVVSLGHTESDYKRALSAIDAGAMCLTHTFNAMPPLHHREPSCIGAAFDRQIYVQAICDGVHIHESVLRMLYKLFSDDKMIIISDCMRATGLSDGEYDLGGQTVTVCKNQARLADGTLAGSNTCLFDCVKHMIGIGIPKYSAVKMASETPASLLGMQKGKLQVGYDAEFFVCDSDFNLKMTFTCGKEY